MGMSHDVHVTEGPGHAVEIARDLYGTATKIISVGGDGTHNEAVCGYALAGVPNDKTRVGFLTLGTGGDFRKTLRLPPDPLFQLENIAEDIRKGRSHPIDIGKMTFVDHAGNDVERAFLNIASFGIGGEVDDRVNRTTKLFGGFTSFLIGSLRAAVTYKNKTVRLKLDRKNLGEVTVLNVAVANGRFFGGGMQVAPDAHPDDGLFDVVIIGDLSARELVRLTPTIYMGRHLDQEKVVVHKGRKLVAESDDIVLLDVDGEAPGRLPATFEVVPEAVRVLGVRFPTD